MKLAIKAIIAHLFPRRKPQPAATRSVADICADVCTANLEAGRLKYGW